MTVTYKLGDKKREAWGAWEVLDVGEKHVVRRITVESGSSIPLQTHEHRDLHWVIVSGTASVTVGSTVSVKRQNGGVFIPKGTLHRIANQSDTIMEFVEVQFGEILDEEDLITYSSR